LNRTAQLALALGPALGNRLIRRGDQSFGRLAEVVYTGFGNGPALIARPETTAEVSTVIAAANESGIEFAVRGRGHSFSRYGTIADGLVVDLRLMGASHIDSAARIGTASASTPTGVYTRSAGDHGLATGFGDHPDVGIPGLVLGGGIGYLSRRDGLTIDNLIDAEVVLADASVVTASAEEHTDLFWALRGGGGNFGVITKMRMRLTPTPLVTGGLIAFKPSAETIENLFETARIASDEVTLMINVMKAPPAPYLPEDLIGTPIVTVHICHAGDPAAAAADLGPIRAAGPVLVDQLRAQPYAELFDLATDQQGTRTLRSTGFVDSFTSARAEVALEWVANAPTSAAIVNLRPMGGAIARVPEFATAFAHRNRVALASVRAIDRDPARAEAGERWVEQIAEAINVRGPGAVNFLGDYGVSANDAYPPSALSRLQQVKATYDPQNRFRVNCNILPSSLHAESES
jgi:FAD/FMN-containing dehydrogenase